METLARLAQLLEHNYGATNPTLTPIHLFTHADRGIYRVERAGQPPWLLRAYQQEPQQAAWLAERAIILRYLAAADYPAPRVIPTMEGALWAHHQGWSAMLLSYVEGAVITKTTADFYALGQQLARLHNLAVPVDAGDRSRLPDCRWQPPSRIGQWLAELQGIAGQVPSELTGLYNFSCNTLTQVTQWATRPRKVLHADPNPSNAIRTVDGAVVLVDWDGAGLGPPLLDLAYLLLTCHIVLPTWPQIHPERELIAAIMQGYSHVRPLPPEEVEALPVALCFNDAVWAAQSIPQVIGQDWRQHRGLQRFGARYPTLAQVGEIAQKIITAQP